MRIFAVAQIADLATNHRQGPLVNLCVASRLPAKFISRNLDVNQRGCNGGVISARVLKGLHRKLEAKRRSRPAGAIERVNHVVIAFRVDDNQDVTEVFRGGTHEARPADVDLLDRGHRT